MVSARNMAGLSPLEIERCRLYWEQLGGSRFCPLDTSEAHRHSSATRFNEQRRVVILGANVLPHPQAVIANARLSPLACLAHECSHAERHARGYRRLPEETLIDEAETSLNASCYVALSPRDRHDLVEDAQDRIIAWMSDGGGAP